MMRFKKTMLLSALLVLSAGTAQAQFIQGIGLFGALNTSRQKFVNEHSRDSLAAYYPENNLGAERISWGAGVVLEMFRHKHIRWQTELEYTNKGSKQNELLNVFTDEHEKRTNKFTYLEWNNFAKFRVEGYSLIGYAMIGARIEYNLTRKNPAYSYITNDFKKLWFNPDVALGTELVSFSRFKLFAELHYNPDILKQYNKDKVWANNRTWELRIGVMFRKNKSLDLDCNAPRYIEP